MLCMWNPSYCMWHVVITWRCTNVGIMYCFSWVITDKGMPFSWEMIDRRGHRKLRLTSRKHFRPKPKRVHDSIGIEQSKEVQPSSLNISFPISAYVNAPVSSLNNLRNRLKSYGAIPSGTWQEYANSLSYTFALLVLTTHFCCVLIGWTDELKEETLVFKTRPGVVLSLTVHEDFSWTLCYQRQCIHQEFCCLLKDLPSEINTGKLLSNVGIF